MPTTTLTLLLLLPTLSCAQISMTGGTIASGGIASGLAPQLLMVFGDSIGTGAGATPQLQAGFAGVISAHYGWEQVNIAVGGSGVGDWAQFQNGSPYDATAHGVATTIFGVAEMFTWNSGTTPLEYVNWQKAATANILHSAIALTEHKQAGTWTLGGTWTSSNVSGIPTYDRQNNRASTVVGSTATISVTGTTAYLVYLADQPSGDVSFNVSIDGVSQGNFSTQGNAQSVELEHYRYYTAALRFPGLSSGAHTMVVTYTSGTTPLILMWAAGNTLTNHPRYFVGNCLPEEGGTIAADIATYNTNLATVVGNLVSDGLAVYLTNTHDAIDPNNASLWNSTLHPSTSGHALLATAFEAVIDAHP